MTATPTKNLEQRLSTVGLDLSKPAPAVEQVPASIAEAYALALENECEPEDIPSAVEAIAKRHGATKDVIAVEVISSERCIGSAFVDVPVWQFSDGSSLSAKGNEADTEAILEEAQGIYGDGCVAAAEMSV